MTMTYKKALGRTNEAILLETKELDKFIAESLKKKELKTANKFLKDSLNKLKHKPFEHLRQDGEPKKEAIATINKKKTKKPFEHLEGK